MGLLVNEKLTTVIWFGPYENEHLACYLGFTRMKNHVNSKKLKKFR
jgi:hypothetical protein